GEGTRPEGGGTRAGHREGCRPRAGRSPGGSGGGNPGPGRGVPEQTPAVTAALAARLLLCTWRRMKSAGAGIGAVADSLFLGRCRSPFLEGLPDLREPFGFFRRDAAPEAQEHLEGGLAGAVEELQAERPVAAEVAGLLHGEDGPDL